MTYDNQKAIRRALRLARGGYAGGGAGMGGVATQGGPDGAAGATPKGFSPSNGEAPPPQVMGSPDAAGAPPKGFTPGATSYQPPPQPAPLPTGPSADFYQNLLSGMQFAQPTYRAYQPGDFAPQQLRQTYRFDPATDPSRIVNAELARLKAEKEAGQNQTQTPAASDYNYIDYGGGGNSSGDGEGGNANGGRIVNRRPFALGGQPTANDYEDQYGSYGALPVNFDGGNFGAPDPGAPTGAPGTGNFGTDLAGFGEAVGPALGGAAVGAALGGPAGAAVGMVGGTMAQGLAEALGLSAPATSPVGGLASVAGNIAQTQMGMTPTSNPMGAIADALTGPPAPADQEDADQGAAAAAAAAAAQAAAEADNTNSMSEASTADAAGPGDDSGGPGGDGDFARGGVVGDAEDHGGQHEYEARCFANGGEIDPPEKTVRAYKLFKTKKNSPGKLFPLFVNADKPVPVGKWIAAEEGPIEDGKVKSSLGKLAYRPGWHAGDLPVATHIGRKSEKGLTKPDYRPDNHVWAEVEMPADVDWQSVAEQRADRDKSGEIIPKTAHITDQIPHGGFYRYKTNPNMTGNWLISGGMKVNRVLSDDEVKQINDEAGVADLPRLQDLKASNRYADGGEIMPQRDLDADPAVQQALDITRQAQADQPSTTGTMQLAQAVTAPGRRRFEIAPARVAPATIADRPRDLPEEGSVTIKRLTDAFKKAIDNHLALSPAEQIANARQAENNVAQYVGRGKTGKINSVLTANKKLMKAQTAGEDDTPLTLPDGRTLEMTGLALMPDYREGQFKMCGNSDVCRDLCLGKESGQYRYDPTATQAQMPVTKEQLAEAGGKPRMAAFRRTMAMMRDPESFAVYLHELIDGAKIMAEKRGAHLGVRLNVLSDLSPKIMEPIIKAHPDVSFYDYTKMNYDPVADNHHYTYSSTGLSQPERGVENPFSNWRKMRDRLDQGHNVAMAFAHGKSDAFPEHLHDEETGKKYRVVSGDEHDFRPLDIVPEGEAGVIIALKNMAASNSEYKYENAARNSHGFFVHHDPDFERTPKGTFAVDQEGNRISRNKVYKVPVQPMKRGAVRPQEN